MDREEMRRNARYLSNVAGHLDTSVVQETRGSHGKKKWSIRQLVISAVMSLVSGAKTLREMEKETRKLSFVFRKVLHIRGRLPDTTMWDYLLKADLSGLRKTLQNQAKQLHRSKATRKASGVPINILSFDGKYEHIRVKKESGAASEFFQQKGQPDGNHVRGEVRSISVSLVSSRSTLNLDMIPVPGRTNEMGAFKKAFLEVFENWGQTELMELVATDSGSASYSNAKLVDDAGVGYLMVLDAFQKELLKEAHRQIGSQSQNAAEAFTSERYQGHRVEYRIWRTREMTNWNGWDHLRQVLRVERRVINDDPNISDITGTRYFLTNLPYGRLSAKDWLTVIRLRWQVENGTHWTLDAILKEDKHLWIKQPHGLLAVQFLRRIALNILAVFRGIHMRSEDNRRRPWKDIIDDFKDALRFAQEFHLNNRRELKSIATAVA